MTSILKHEVQVVLAVTYKQNVTEICIYKAELSLKMVAYLTASSTGMWDQYSLFCGQSSFPQHREFHSKN